MCGIAGAIGRPGDPSLAEAELRRMCAAIRHRGPDDEGRHVEPGVALGMRRLSIIDVASGHQPIFNEDRSALVVFNGEIYNHHEIRARLERGGHRFATQSDTEVLVHLYEDLGANLTRELRGMFGFAIWDRARHRLVLGRDRLGIKPLYYWETDGMIAFASELRSFLQLPDFPRRLDRAAVARFLALGYVPDPECIYEGVRKLPPGHVLEWDREHGSRITRYWSPAIAEDPTIDEETAVTELRRLLRSAVQSHLESEVPLGAFLSGGLDSSTVVALMRESLDRPVRTFSIGFDEPEYDETPYAASVASALGTIHTELIVRPDADALVERVISLYDEPFADASALPTLLVSELARQQVTVALSGDGGDELFGGYTRYLAVGRQELGAPMRRALRTVARMLPHRSPGRGRLIKMSHTLHGQYAAQVAAPITVADGGVLQPELAQMAGPLDTLLQPWFEEVPDRDFVSQMMIVDLMSYLPGDILTKVDRASMAVSLEARVPLLDHHLVEFAVSLPSHLKVRDGTGKWIFRRAITGIVPDEIFTRPKRGFTLPLRRWFARELRYRLHWLCEPDRRIYEFVSRDAVARLVGEHVAGRRDNYFWLWRLLVLEVWLRHMRV